MTLPRNLERQPPFFLLIFLLLPDFLATECSYSIFFFFICKHHLKESFRFLGCQALWLASAPIFPRKSWPDIYTQMSSRHFRHNRSNWVSHFLPHVSPNPSLTIFSISVIDNSFLIGQTLAIIIDSSFTHNFNESIQKS